MIALLKRWMKFGPCSTQASVFVFGLLAWASTTFGHVRFEEPSSIEVEIMDDLSWTALARLDAEFIFLNAPNGWLDAPTQKELDELYWDFSVKGEIVRAAILESLAARIKFVADGKALESELVLSTDPLFAYEASQEQSLWGLVKLSGVLPEGAQELTLLAPPEFYPLNYSVQTTRSAEPAKDFFDVNSERIPRSFRIDTGTFLVAEPLSSAIVLD